MSIHTFNGKWLLAGAGIATSADCCCGDPPPEPPIMGACCAGDGTCSQTSEEDCEGTWHSEISCEDIDCASGCCTFVTIDGCAVRLCSRGFIEGCAPCDPNAAPAPSPPNYDCLGGSPATVTVTGSGAVAMSGDPVFDSEINSMLNASYAIDIGCNGSGSASFAGPTGYRVDVSAVVSFVRFGGINIISLFSGTGVAGMAVNLAGGAPTITECGHSLYPCDPFSGLTSFGGPVDFTGADVDVS